MEESEIFRSFYDNPFICIYLADLEGNFLDANETALKLFGFLKEEIAHLNYSSMLSDEGLQVAIEAQQDLINTGNININDISINKNTTTLNGVVAVTSYVMCTGPINHPICTRYPNTEWNGVWADPLKIDVATLGAANAATQPFAALANKTAVIISLSDSIQTIDSISIGSITLDNGVATVLTGAVALSGSNGIRGVTPAGFYAALNQGGQYYYSNTFAQQNSHQLGQLYIRGFKQIGYSHLEGYQTSDVIGGDGLSIVLPVANRPAYIAIFAHDTHGN